MNINVTVMDFQGSFPFLPVERTRDATGDNLSHDGVMFKIRYRPYVSDCLLNLEPFYKPYVRVCNST